MLDRSIPPTPRPVKKFQIQQAQTHLLDNGTPVYAIDAGIQPVTKIEVFAPAGSWYEPEIGIAHFTSQMLSEGTSRKTSREITDLIESLGAHIDLQAGFEYISLSIYCLAKNLKQLIPLLGELFFEPVFPREEFATLKNIAVQGLKVNNEKPSFVATRLFRRALFGNKHPYGKILEEPDIRSIESENLKQFHDQRFQFPWQIIISGSLPRDYKGLLNKHFGKRSLAPPLAKSNNRVSGTGNIYIHREKSLQSALRLGRLVVNRKHEDYLKLMVLNEILGGYFGSRLMRNIREEKGYTYGIHSHIASLIHTGYWVIEATVKKEYTNQTIDEILKEMKTLKQEKVQEDELETVKNYMLGSFLSELDTPFALADKFKAIHFHGLDYDYYNRFFQTIQEMNPSILLELANQYLSEDEFVEVVVGER